MQSNNLIEKKLLGYEDFLKYCEESGKKFIDELDKEDFIAYRAEYSVSRERIYLISKSINLLKKFLNRKIFLTSLM